MKLNVICANCRWWKQEEDTDKNGQCIRYPPHNLHGWPHTGRTDACGEFHAKPEFLPKFC